MEIEELFEMFQEEINEIYEGFELNEKAIENIEKAVKEVLATNVNIAPSNFISIIYSIASGANQVTPKGRSVNLSYKDILERANHAIEIYDDDNKTLVKNIANSNC